MSKSRKIKIGIAAGIIVIYWLWLIVMKEKKQGRHAYGTGRFLSQ